MAAEDEEVGSGLPQRNTGSDAELDMTPMIDCVFLLLIYFLVASRPESAAIKELPGAQYGDPVSSKVAVVLSIAMNGDKTEVYLADGKKGSPLGGADEQQETEIAQYVKKGLDGGKEHLLIKAEAAVKHREVTRVSRAALGDMDPEQLKIYLAVTEKKQGGGAAP